MKKTLLFVLMTMFLMVSIVSAAQIEWNDDLMWWDKETFTWEDDSKTIEIINGDSVTIDSGYFVTEKGETIHAKAELIQVGTSFKKLIHNEEFFMDPVLMELPDNDPNKLPTPFFNVALDSNDYNGLGNYKVKITLEVVDSDELTLFDSLNLEVSPVPSQPPTVDFTWVPNVPQMGNTVTFTPTVNDPDGDNNNIVYSWDFNDNGFEDSNSETPAIVFDAEGAYPVTLTVTDEDGVSASETKTVQVSGVANHPPVVTLDYENAMTGDQNIDVGESVKFTATATDIDGDDLLYSWDFDNDGNFEGESPSNIGFFQYAQPGAHVAWVGVSDGQSFVTESVIVNIGGYLLVDNIDCLPEVIEGNNQYCDVHVVDSAGEPVDGATVEIHYDNSGVQKGPSCVTGEAENPEDNTVTGACSVKYQEDLIGEYTVYATASKLNYAQDIDHEPTFTYNVLGHKYNIVDLEVYESPNDLANNVPSVDKEFYRNEDMYVRFRVMEDDNSFLVPDEINQITKVYLQGMGGKKILMTKIPSQAPWLQYKLDPIPLDDEYLGLGQVITFAIDVNEQLGDQEELDVTILNNPPQINVFGDIVVADLMATQIDLFDHADASDVEDDETELRWSISNVDPLATFTADIEDDHLLNILPMAEGFSQATFTVMDTNGATASVDVTIYVGGQAGDLTTTIIATPAADEDPTWVLQEGDVDGFKVDFTHNTVGAVGQLTFEWDFDNDGVIDSLDENPTHAYMQPGAYLAVLTVQDAFNQIATDTFAIEIGSDGMVVEIEASTNGGGVPFDGTFTANVEGGFGDLTYEWSVDGVVQPETTEEFVYTFTEEKEYEVKVVVTDNFGNTAEDSIKITGEPDQEVTFNLVANPLKGHAPLDVNFEVVLLSGNSPFTYEWDLGDDSSENKKAFKHLYTEEGDYEVSVIVTDGDGDKASATVTIHVKDTKTQVTPRKVVGWSKLNLINGEVYSPGEFADVLVNFENKGNWDMEDVKVAVTIPELAVRRTAGPFDVGEGEEITRVMQIEIPFYAQPGEYDLRVVISTDGDDKVHRIKHRRIIIE